MISIMPGMTRDSVSSFERLAFDRYDLDGDGVISSSEYNNFVQVSGVNKVEPNNKKPDKGFNLEQFDPQGSINFESNGGFNSKFLNIIA